MDNQEDQEIEMEDQIQETESKDLEDQDQEIVIDLEEIL